MRKFYTMLAALVCASSMIASAAGFTPKAPRTGHPMTNAAITAEAPQFNMPTLKASTPKTATSYADAYVGLWDMAYYYYNSSYQNWYLYNAPVEIAKVDDTHISISNFWDYGTNALTAEVDASGSVTIPVDQVLFTDSDYGNVGVCLMSNQGSAYTTSPVTLAYSYGSLYMTDYWCPYLIDGSYAGSAYDYCYYVVMTPCNSQMHMIYPYGGVDYEYYYNCYSEFDNNVLKVYNMMGYGFDDAVEFDVDAETKTAVAQNQAMYTSDDYNYYFYSCDDSGNMDDQVVANIEGDNNNVISFTDWTLYIPEADTSYGQLGTSTVTTPFNLCGDNNSVQANVANENAKVEYFNLQGVKISQPTEKGIYIRRAGNEVSKIAL